MSCANGSEIVGSIFQFEKVNADGSIERCLGVLDQNHMDKIKQKLNYPYLSEKEVLVFSFLAHNILSYLCDVDHRIENNILMVNCKARNMENVIGNGDDDEKMLELRQYLEMISKNKTLEKKFTRFLSDNGICPNFLIMFTQMLDSHYSSIIR